MDAKTLWDSLGDWHVWAVVAVTAAVCAAGGAIHAATRSPDADPTTPDETNAERRARLLKELLVGALAAVAVLYYVEPKPAPQSVGAPPPAPVQRWTGNGSLGVAP